MIGTIEYLMKQLTTRHTLRQCMHYCIDTYNRNTGFAIAASRVNKVVRILDSGVQHFREHQLSRLGMLNV